MGNPNRGGATKIKYVPDEKAKASVSPKLVEMLKNLEEIEIALETRIQVMEDKFIALEEFVGAKQEDEKPKEKKPK